MRNRKFEKVSLQQSDIPASSSCQPSVHGHIQSRDQVKDDHRSSMPASVPSSMATQARENPATRTKRREPEEIAAQKALTALEIQIRTIRNEVDALEQAANLASSTTDADLEALITKWKAASQTAAEELFGGVKERVCRMGGVTAWRESEKQRHDRAGGLGEFKEDEVQCNDADCEFDSQGEELCEEEQEFRKREKRRLKREREEAADVDEDVSAPQDTEEVNLWQEGSNDDDVGGGNMSPCTFAYNTDYPTGIHNRYDAAVSQNRARGDWVRQGHADVVSVAVRPLQLHSQCRGKRRRLWFNQQALSLHGSTT